MRINLLRQKIYGNMWLFGIQILCIVQFFLGNYKPHEYTVTIQCNTVNLAIQGYG